jgi:hypothetical protein
MYPAGSWWLYKAAARVRRAVSRVETCSRRTERDVKMASHKQTKDGLQATLAVSKGNMLRRLVVCIIGTVGLIAGVAVLPAEVASSLPGLRGSGSERPRIVGDGRF